MTVPDELTGLTVAPPEPGAPPSGSVTEPVLGPPSGPPPGPPSPGRTCAEVRAAFEAYEAALSAHDLAALDRFFLPSPQVRRFGVDDEQHGATAVRAWRASSAGVPPGRWLEATEIQVLRPDVAVVTTRFGYGSGAADGRQTQVWVRGDAGWQIASAHVSLPASEGAS